MFVGIRVQRRTNIEWKIMTDLEYWEERLRVARKATDECFTRDNLMLAGARELIAAEMVDFYRRRDDR